MQYSPHFCPANWRLPLSSSTNNGTSGSFYYLLNQYSLTSSPTSGNNNIATSPLYFVRSGYVYPLASRLYSAGDRGDYWSGRAYSSSIAYELYFYSSTVFPSSRLPVLRQPLSLLRLLGALRGWLGVVPGAGCPGCHHYAKSPKIGTFCQKNEPLGGSTGRFWGWRAVIRLFLLSFATEALVSLHGHFASKIEPNLPQKCQK